MEKYYIYIMSNKTGSTIYVGVTNNLVNRVAEHRTRDNKSFTSWYNCHKLVYYEEYSMNPERVDLLPEIATSLRSSQ